MPSPLDWISIDPSVEKLSEPRLSLSQYNNLAQEYLNHIDAVKERLQHIYVSFNGSGTLLPVTCKETLNMLDTLLEQIEAFCKLLDKASRLPLVITILQYELLYACNRIKAQASKLEDLIENYLKTCKSSSAHSQLKKIYHNFEALFQLITDTSQCVKFQCESARFQEKGLISIFEEI